MPYWEWFKLIALSLSLSTVMTGVAAAQPPATEPAKPEAPIGPANADPMLAAKPQPAVDAAATKAAPRLHV